MVRKQLYIDDRQDELLKALAKKTGRTESDLIREAIDSTYDEARVIAERMAAHQRLVEAMDKLSAHVEQSGQTVVWEGREALYRDYYPKRRGGGTDD